MNMGTPLHPEGTPHWATKVVLWNRLKNALSQEDKASYYGRATPHEFRSIEIADHMRDQPDFEVLESALASQRSRPYPRRSCFHVIYREPFDCICGGGFPVVHNLLHGLRGGRAELEEPFNRFTPDISLYARNAWKPTAIIEVVDTSSPSWKKIDTLRQQGIDVYAVRVGDDARGTADEDPGYLTEPVIVEPYAVPCRARKMEELVDLDTKSWSDYHKEMGDYTSAVNEVNAKYEADGDADMLFSRMSQIRDTCGFPYQAFIGIKEYASKRNLIDVDIDGVQHQCWDGFPTGTGTQRFIYGRASHSGSFRMGDPQVRGFTLSPAPFVGPEVIDPAKEHRISRDQFMDYLVYLKGVTFALWADHAEGGPTPRIHPRHIDQIDDLLCMVGWPNA